MRLLIISIVLLPLCTTCTSRFHHVGGVYDMVGYGGKPLPFDGIRSGKLALSVDGGFASFTRRAIAVGKPESVVDTVYGRFALTSWYGDCIAIVLRAADQTLVPEVWGDVCGDELTIRENRGLFRKRR
jgi:hypothetical protein